MISSFRERDRGDEGMTLVELLITSAVLVLLLGLVMVSMNLIETLSTNVSAQYQEFDQVIPALAPIRSLVASEVEPAPQANGGFPPPAFQSVGNFAVTWYANIGTQYSNVVGYSSSCPSKSCTAGPAQIVAEEIAANGSPVTSTSAGPNTQCTVAGPCSLQVRMYLPLVGVTSPGVSTCPVPVNGTSGGTCQYSNSYRLVANIQDVVNSPADVDVSGNPVNPIFTYTIVDPTTSASFILTPSDLNQVPQVVTGLPVANPGATTPPQCTVAVPCSYPSSTQALVAALGNPTCLSTSTLVCPLDDIQSVGIHLIVSKPGTQGNGAVENQIIEYRYPLSTNASCYPFQYITGQCNPYES